MRKSNPYLTLVASVLVLALAGWLLYQIPALNERLSWRVDIALTYLRGMLNPVKPLPTPVAHSDHTPVPTFFLTTTQTPTPRPTSEPSPTPTFTPTPIPGSASLPSPTYVKQSPNNCGPASLAMNLYHYGWMGTQKDIADIIKPTSADRNVNVEELVYFVRNYAGWLNAEFRVGGDLTLLKRLLAAGFPVIIEESFFFTEDYWPNDDGWAAHYFLLTAYDDTAQTFTGQDSYFGPDQKVSYAELDEKWKIFNRVMILLYLPQQQSTIQAILGLDWDADTNRQRALETAQAETRANPENAFAWFNIGSNLVYFERYEEAVEAYQQAITLGLPQRMLRYQFGPFFAYFHTQRSEDLLALAEYALQRTPNSEEALLWKGWALYRTGRSQEAINAFKDALEANPNYQDARFALDFVAANP